MSEVQKLYYTKPAVMVIVGISYDKLSLWASRFDIEGRKVGRRVRYTWSDVVKFMYIAFQRRRGMTLEGVKAELIIRGGWPTLQELNELTKAFDTQYMNKLRGVCS